ncbi:MAG: 50S ribosome-binding GTPase [Helicobacter sp.]|nr:50S ribosome-binding GTPase [Helicobacter sp.]
MNALERMHIVITGHVDHGKSTLVGRLLADTHSLPQGKLEGVRASCAKNARPFEYSMLLDALEDEQKQGITIDSARIFFKSARREYVIIDAPGHIEFLRNMLSGASRAEAAVLVIDAKDGVAENSKRHGMLLSMLGISQVIVVINKLDLFAFEQQVFERIRDEYIAFLATLNVVPVCVIPISAREGDNVATESPKMSWYRGGSLLQNLDSLSNKNDSDSRTFLLPLQDVYRFSNEGDERRIYAGTVVSGSAKVGDSVLFLPSQKAATIERFEVWNAPQKQAIAWHEAVGISLREDIYVKPGEVMVLKTQWEQGSFLRVATQLRVNLIWLGRNPLCKNKAYLLKLGSAKIKAELAHIERVLEADNEEHIALHNANELFRNQAGTVILRLHSPLVCARFADNQTLGRFVLVDEYDAAAGGIVLDIPQSAAVSEVATALVANDSLPSGFEAELFALLRKYFPRQFGG